MDKTIKSKSKSPSLWVYTSANEQQIFLAQGSKHIEIDMAVAAELAVTLMNHINEQAIKHGIV